MARIQDITYKDGDDFITILDSKQIRYSTIIVEEIQKQLHDILPQKTWHIKWENAEMETSSNIDKLIEELNQDAIKNYKGSRFHRSFIDNTIEIKRIDEHAFFNKDHILSSRDKIKKSGFELLINDGGTYSVDEYLKLNRSCVHAYKPSIEKDYNIDELKMQLLRIPEVVDAKYKHGIYTRIGILPVFDIYTDGRTPKLPEIFNHCEIKETPPMKSNEQIKEELLKTEGVLDVVIQEGESRPFVILRKKRTYGSEHQEKIVDLNLCRSVFFEDFHHKWTGWFLSLYYGECHKIKDIVYNNKQINVFINKENVANLSYSSIEQMSNAWENAFPEFASCHFKVEFEKSLDERWELPSDDECFCGPTYPDPEKNKQIKEELLKLNRVLDVVIQDDGMINILLGLSDGTTDGININKIIQGRTYSTSYFADFREKWTNEPIKDIIYNKNNNEIVIKTQDANHFDPLNKTTTLSPWMRCGRMGTLISNWNVSHPFFKVTFKITNLADEPCLTKDNNIVSEKYKTMKEASETIHCSVGFQPKPSNEEIKENELLDKLAGFKKELIGNYGILNVYIENSHTLIVEQNSSHNIIKPFVEKTIDKLITKRQVVKWSSISTKKENYKSKFKTSLVAIASLLLGVAVEFTPIPSKTIIHEGILKNVESNKYNFQDGSGFIIDKDKISGIIPKGCKVRLCQGVFGKYYFEKGE